MNRTDRRPVTRAAGAVLWRPGAGAENEFAVVHRPRYDDWSLPKGKLDPGETPPVAAVRELAEETGFTAVLGRFLKRVEYDVGKGRKTVDYFSARAGSGVFEPNGEVDELCWLPRSEAEPLLSYDTDRAVLREFLALPAQLTTLLLIRHAKAGKRESWVGDDDLRPLSEAGFRQAEGLRVLARPFGPDRVLSAPRLRCVQTVLGVADDLGTEVVHEPSLSEEGFLGETRAALGRLRELVAQGGTPLMCSQGGVIPELVRALGEHDGVAVPVTKSGRVPCKKGSLWLLSFTPGANATDNGAGPRLVDATYLPSALPSPVRAPAAE